LDRGFALCFVAFGVPWRPLWQTKIAVSRLGRQFRASRPELRGIAPCIAETTAVSIVPGRFSSPASSSACGFDGGKTVVAQFLAHHALWCRHGGAAIAAEKPRLIS
jgi:hypothetical protein